MKVELYERDPFVSDAEVIVLGVYDDLKVEWQMPFGDLFKRKIEQYEFKGKVGESFFVTNLGERTDKEILIVGLGNRKDVNFNSLRSSFSLATRKLQEKFVKKAIFDLRFESEVQKMSELISLVVETLLLTNTKFRKYKTKKEKQYEGLKEVYIGVERISKDFKKALNFGIIVADSVIFARNLVTMPSNEVTPKYLADEALKLSKKYNFKIKVLNEKECEKMGMGAFLAVAKGSNNPPRFIHISYKHPKAKERIGIIGKGLTFDSGGISLKPAEGMGAMKGDMAGAAAALGVMKAIGEIKPVMNVDMVVAACENMPSGSSYKPGDVVKSMSGKTIEVQNTDAEGRLTLADALTYIQKENIKTIIDLATLTGACVVALGTDIAGIMGNDKKLIEDLKKVSEETGDKIWELPLEEGYMRFIKSDIADICNISKVRWGGAITAGLFLKFFVEENVRWAHLDIAGPSFREDDLNENHRGEGSGFGVRLLLKYILKKEKAS